MTLSFTKNNNQWDGNGAAKMSEGGKDQIIVPFIVQTTCIFWIVTKLICWRLWTIERLLPTAPPFDFLEAPAAVHLVLLAASLLLMFFLVLKPGNKLLLVALLISEVLSCLLDQSRWQPWEYQFIFIVLINIINHRQPQKIVPGIGFLMVSTYAYSGLGKFSPSFLALFWDNMLLKQYLNIDPAVIHNNYVHYSGYMLAFIELLFGIGLFFRATQKFAAWAIIVMHLLIVIMVGPFGLRYNISVWPWNIMMMIHLYILFIYRKTLAIDLPTLWKGWNKIIIICWGILPMLNHTVGWWDNALSSRLFAGNHYHMNLCVKDSTEIKQLRPFLYSSKRNAICDSGTLMVNLQSWGLAEMRSPVYTEVRAYKKIAKKWISNHKGTSTKAVVFLNVRGGGVKIVPEE